MNTAEMLNEYRRTVTEIDELEHQLEQASPSGRPSGVRGAGQREEGATNHGMAARLQLADGLAELIRVKREQLAGMNGQVWQALARVANGREMQVVQQYYLMGDTDDAVAMAMGLSRARVNQIRLGFLRRAGGMENGK